MNAVTRSLRAFPTILRVGFAESVAYRAEMIIWMLTTTMPLVSLALWSAVAASAPVGSFSQHGFAAYFLATVVVRQLTGSWLVWELNMDVRSGALARRLLKPIHPLVAYAGENMAAIPMRALISLPVTALALFVVGGAAPRTPALVLVFFLSLVLAWLINFSTMAIVGCLAFFLESSTSIFEIWLVAFMILSGYLVPLELFPPTVRAITHALPFRYTIAYPVEIVIGHLDLAGALDDLAIQAAWAFALFAGAIFTWRAGIKRYAAYGG